MTIGLSLLLSMFERPGITVWPRKAMALASKGQVTVNDSAKLQELIETSALLDCYLQSHTAEDRSKGLLYLVFIDIDCLGNLARAEKLKSRVVSHIKKEFEVKPYVQFSGFKGYHVIVPMKTTQINSPSMAPEFLKFCQLRLSKGYCDPQILGDVIRLVRIPHTYNSKAVRAGMDGLVTPIQEWDGRELDPGLLWEEFKLEKLEEELYKTEKRGEKARPIKPNGELKQPRPCIVRALQHPLQEGNGHLMRLAVAAEYLNLGWAPSEIAQLFQNQSDYSYEKSLYFVEDAQKRGYKPFKCKTIQSLGYCLLECKRLKHPGRGDVLHGHVGALACELFEVKEG